MNNQIRRLCILCYRHMCKWHRPLCHSLLLYTHIGLLIQAAGYKLHAKKTTALHAYPVKYSGKQADW